MPHNRTGDFNSLDPTGGENMTNFNFLGLAELHRTTFLASPTDGTFPKRKSKFLKMLKVYTANKYGDPREETKSPALQNIEKAKEDLKSISRNLNTYGEGLEKIREKFSKTQHKKVTKVKKLSELVETSNQMNKRKESKMQIAIDTISSSSESSSGKYDVLMFNLDS